MARQIGVDDSWLLVWSGDGPWRTDVDRERERIGPENRDAHELLFREEAGERWALLLVHWTPDERDALIAAFGDRWDYCFSNVVRDLAHS